MASIFRQQFTTAGENGKRIHKRSQYWYIDYKAAGETRKRVKGFKDKTATAQLAAKLEKEAELADSGLVDRFKEQRQKPLAEHLADFRRNLGETSRHAIQTERALQRVFEGCKFYRWADISASRFWDYLKSLQNGGISQRTFNFYLKAGKQFCRWMVQDQRAAESPLAHLKTETVTKQVRRRRALELDEIRLLLETTKAQPTRFGMTGYERALLYQLAVETGLRAAELRSLTVSSFDFDNCEVTIEAAYAKN
ncbi:MAG: tyrosine-type recombinase/integrase, partial [Planctomycetes bacterium]|nr:tyrosine-type recombinase/integrase [Planctomycetota bacterium]